LGDFRRSLLWWTVIFIEIYFARILYLNYLVSSFRVVCRLSGWLLRHCLIVFTLPKVTCKLGFWFSIV
jgi:hypothetical protein